MVSCDDQRVREGLVDYIVQKGGGLVHASVTDYCFDEVRAYAASHGLTPIDAARSLCQTTNSLLREHGNDALAACLAADAAGIAGAALLGLIIHQGRRRIASLDGGG